MSENGKDGLDIRGVIFQFNPESVLFEFTFEGQEEVGMVKPNHLKVRGKVIPASVKKVDTLAKYIEVGDEVKCHVVKKEGLKAFKYTEEDDDGKPTEMEIQPNWMANEAVKLDGSEGDSTESKKDEASNGSEGGEKGKEKEKNDAILMPPPPPTIRSVTKPKTGSKKKNGDHSESEEDDNKKNEALEKKSDENQKELNINDDDILQLEVQLGSEFDEFKDEELDMDGMEVVDELPDGDDDVEEITILDDSKDEKKRSRSDSQDKVSPKKRSKEDTKSTNGQPRAKTPPPPKMSLPKPVKAKAGSKSKETPKLPSPVRAQASNKESPKLPTPVRAQSSPKPTPPPPETPTVQAKVLQLKKPTNSKLQGRVFCGIMEIEDGEHKGKRGFFQTSSTYVWGYHMSKANLMYHVRAGDSFICEVTPAQRDNQDVQLIVKKAWLGARSEQPQTAADNAEFSAWLVDHCLDEEMFLQWVNDDLPPKPFFPLPSKTYEAVVVMLIRETTNTGDGALVRIMEEGSLKDSLVLFERDDFYVCGVHVGEADMRFLIRPGDQVSCQVQEVTGREKVKMISKYPKTEEYEFNHIGLLAYVGAKRPKSATLKPADSVELHRFLDGKGITVEEFSQMREKTKEKEEKEKESTPERGPVEIAQNQAINPSIMQPNLMPPNVPLMGMMPSLPPGYPAMMNTQTPNYDLVTKCSTLTAKAVLMGTPENPNIGDLVSSMEDVDNALFLSKMLTASLLVKMQSHMKAQLAAKYGSNIQTTLTTQAFQITAAETQLRKPAEVPLAAPVPMSEPMMVAQQKSLESLPAPAHSAVQLPQPVKSIDQRPIADRTLSALEKQMKDKVGDGKQAEKRQPIKRDMKKLLQSFAASKNPKVVKSKPSSRFNKEGSPDIIYVDNISAQQEKKRKEVDEEKELSPLELIRKYNIEGKPVVMKDGFMHFGEIAFPKETKTNFKIFRKEELMGAPKEYYTLECLHHFLNNIHLDHVVYVRTALQDNIKVVVRRPDRANLKKYLTGEMSYVLNLENISHRDLNPGMFSLAGLGDDEEASREMRKSESKNSSEYGGGSEYGGASEYGSGKPESNVNKQANDALEQWKAKHLGKINADLSQEGGRDRDGDRRERRRDRSRSRERERRNDRTSDRDLREDRHRSSGERDRGDSRDRHGNSREKDRDMERSRPRFDSYDPLIPSKSPPPAQAYDPCNPTTSPRALGRSVPEQRKSRFDVKETPDMVARSREVGDKFMDPRASASLNPFDNREAANPFDNRFEGSGPPTNPFDNRSSGNPFDNRNSQSDRDRLDIRGRASEENPFDSRSKGNPFDNREKGNPFDNRLPGFGEEERNPFDNRADDSSGYDDRHPRDNGFGGRNLDRWNEDGQEARNFRDRYNENQTNSMNPWMRNEPSGMNSMMDNAGFRGGGMGNEGLRGRGMGSEGFRSRGMNEIDNEDQDFGPSGMNPLFPNQGMRGFPNGRMGQSFGRGGGGFMGNGRQGGGATGLGPMFNNY